MRSAFSQKNETEDCSIYINVESDKDGKADFKLTNDNKPFSSWECEIEIQNSEGSTPGLIDILNNVYFSNSVSEKEKKESISQLKELFSKLADFKNQDKTKDEWEKYLKDNLLHSLSKNEVLTKYYINNKIQLNDVTSALSKFIIYSPENSHLRSTEKSSSSIEPLGIKGEGLLKLVYILSNIENKKIIATVKENLKLLGWFSDFNVKSETSGYGLEIVDQYLKKTDCTFDQDAANEGFMFLLFYFSLFASPITPSFFAIDNIDTSLNPKLCQKLIQQLINLAKKQEKQVILTTHNPSILDGLNLDDPEQKLYAVSRARNGQTKASQILKPKSLEGAKEIRLSEMFLRGLIGGLPKGF
tara:strand:+ start:3153 stop:4226 length:1074 start_codon:yes stop_codon:yes gene_type:complete